MKEFVNNRESFANALSKRLGEEMKESKQKRLEKVIQKAKNKRIHSDQRLGENHYRFRS